MLRFLAAVIALTAVPVVLNRARASDESVCPVTRESDQIFIPPAPWEPKGPWFGTEKLWTRVQMWKNGWQKDAGGYEIPKLAWFSSQFDWTPEHWPNGPNPLTITGRRLDGPSEPLTFHGANSAYIPGKGPFTTASAHVPSAGCWEITGHYKEQDLRFVVKIGP
jgi:hypothetical protein